MSRKAKPNNEPFPADARPFARRIHRQYLAIRDNPELVSDAVGLLAYLNRIDLDVKRSLWFVKEVEYMMARHPHLTKLAHWGGGADTADAAVWRHVGVPFIEELQQDLKSLLQEKHLPSVDAAWVPAHIENAKRDLAYWEAQA